MTPVVPNRLPEAYQALLYSRCAALPAEQRESLAAALAELGEAIVAGAYPTAQSSLDSLQPQLAALDEPFIQAFAALQQGRILFGTGRSTEALPYLERSLALTQDDELLPLRAEVLRALGGCYHLLNDYALAAKYSDQAYRLFHRLHDPQGESSVLNNLGLIASALGDWADAQSYHKRSLKLKQATGDLAGESFSLLNLGVIFSKRGRKAEARRYYEEALELKRRLGDRRGELVAMYNLGALEINAGYYDKARQLFLEQMPLRQELGDRPGLGRIHHNLSHIARLTGNYADALQQAEVGLEYYRQSSNRRGQAGLLSEIGLIYLHTGQSELACTYAAEGLEMVISGSERVLEGDARLVVGHLALALGETEAALQSYRLAVAVQSEVGSPPDQVEAQLHLARALAASGDPPAALQQLEAVLARTLDAEPPASLRGVQEPLWGYLIAYEILSQAGDRRTPTVLAHAKLRLREAARKLSNPADRRSFLENVPYHRRLREIK